MGTGSYLLRHGAYFREKAAKMWKSIRETVRDDVWKDASKRLNIVSHLIAEDGEIIWQNLAKMATDDVWNANPGRPNMIAYLLAEAVNMVHNQEAPNIWARLRRAVPKASYVGHDTTPDYFAWTFPLWDQSARPNPRSHDEIIHYPF